MTIYRVTLSDLDLVDVKIEARSPRQAAILLLTTSCKDGFDLDLQDEAEVVVTDHHRKKHYFEVASTSPFRVKTQE
ncbi:MAG TPA: hypothetical protein VE954_27405 [Oligoflexus sp.]|uniref:hypothetical protein n=1 Tax=Oligoflexus sp. TaxID=1971216 RepID=UPI002D26B9E3|nr:hypothetical protein [Oligoflexus sp.]HYX36852.1 hypothetical protein [Oligoflexus sp.]